jgi:hypothetical protein
VNRADEEDFRAFVVARSSALLSFAHVLTGNPRDVEDLVQTALAVAALACRRLRRRHLGARGGSDTLLRVIRTGCRPYISDLPQQMSLAGVRTVGWC